MKTIEQIHAAFQLVHKRACGDTSQVYMTIPPRPEHDADIIVCDAIDELAHLRSTCESLKEALGTISEASSDVTKAMRDFARAALAKAEEGAPIRPPPTSIPKRPVIDQE